MEETCELGRLLSESWELANNIFRFLSYNEIQRAMEVCTLWNEVGKRISEKRRKIHYVTWHPYNLPTTDGKLSPVATQENPRSMLDRFFGHIASRPMICIGFSNEDLIEREDFLKKNEECKGKLTVPDYLTQILPSACETVIAQTTGVIGTVEKTFQGHWLDKGDEFNKELMAVLEGGNNEEKEAEKNDEEKESKKNGENTPSSSSNYCKEREESSISYSIEVESVSPYMSSDVMDGRQREALTLLLLPHHPGVKFTTFFLSNTKYNELIQDAESPNYLGKRMTVRSFEELAKLSPEDRLRAILVFTTVDCENGARDIIHAASERQSEKLAVGGGLVTTLKPHGEQLKVDGVMGVAVSGSNVVAASVVIPSWVRRPKTMEKFMQKLKECSLPEAQSVAFMFTCCGRGYTWYRRFGNRGDNYNNTETKAFRQYFPNTPIFGFFGEGELGLTYLPSFCSKINDVVENENGGDEDRDSQDGVKKKKKKIAKKCMHGFTTIIVLVSFL